jgi:hypothetical protein
MGISWFTPRPKLSTRLFVKPRIFVDSTDALELIFQELMPIGYAMGINIVAYTGDAGKTTLAFTERTNLNIHD